MGKYFGTDGFRGEANIDLTVEHAYKVGRFLGWYFGKDHKAQIVIGKDTRRSSYMFEYSLVAGLTASGADAYLLHVTTTPSVSYVVRTENFDCGIMISASHNPFYDNGIKVINGLGQKLEADIEAQIEAYIDDGTPKIPFATREDIGRTVDFAAGRNRYIGHLISIPTKSFKNMRVGLDCSNGSASSVAKSVFDAIGAKTYVIHNEPDGTNINCGCGSTHIEELQKYVREKHLDVGFAYDGDADRCIAVDDLVTEKMSSYGDEWSGVNLADSQDGLYNAEKAKTEFAKAKDALQADGVQFPIHLDLPVNQSSKLNVAQVQSLKQTIEKSLGSENVVIDINQLSSDDLENATLNAANAAAEDWDISNSVGWAPDYQDPSTYLDIFKTTSSENTKAFMGYDDPNNAAAAQVGLKDYDALLNSAASETSDLNVRYDRYAQAQAWLEDSSLVIPLTVGNGAAPVISRLTPFTGASLQVGDKNSSNDYIKYVKPQEKVVTKKEYEQSREKWLKEKKESNEKAQKDLEKHVK